MLVGALCAKTRERGYGSPSTRLSGCFKVMVSDSEIVWTTVVQSMRHHSISSYLGSVEREIRELLCSFSFLVYTTCIQEFSPIVNEIIASLINKNNTKLTVN